MENEYDYSGDVPQGLGEFFNAGGAANYIGALLFVLVGILWIVAWRKRCRALSVFVVALAVATFFTGMLGTFALMFDCMQAIATSPQASAFDLSLGMYVAQSPMLFGLMFSLLSMPPSFFLLARNWPEGDKCC